MPLSNTLITLNAILLITTLICGAVMLHAGARYSWNIGLSAQAMYQKRILRLILILVALGLIAAALNLFGQ